MDKSKIEEEKTRLIDKLFKCAETPIKDWLATLTDVPITDMFTDYVDDSDVIGFQHAGEYYNAFLVNMNPVSLQLGNESCFVDKQLLASSPEARKACSMLYDAVRMVMPAVTQTLDSTEENSKFRYLTNSFDEQDMCFKFVRINYAKNRFMSTYQQVTQLIACRNQLCEKLEADPETDDAEEIQKNIEQIDTLFKDASKILDSISKQDIEDEQVICNAENIKMESAARLYIAVEKISSDESIVEAVEYGMSRLPMVGLTYQDPDEKTLIDLLKEEGETPSKPQN